MALSKAIPTPYGVPAQYWAITHKTEQFGVGSALTLHGWATEAARRDNAAPLANKQINVAGGDYRREMTTTEDYAVVKRDAEFKGADDVLDAPQDE